MWLRLFCVASLLTPLFAQAPPCPNCLASTPAKWSVSGRVLLANGNAPGKRIPVVAEAPAKRFVVRSDAQGNFELTGDVPGTYIVAAGPGTIMGMPSTDTRTITLNADTRLRDFKLTIHPGASVEGKLLEDDKPLTNCGVLLYAFRQGVRGREFVRIYPYEKPIGADGSFRIDDLPPGRYVLATMTGNPAQPAPASIDETGTEPSLPPVAFYPFGLEPAHAESIELRPGEQRSGLILRLTKRPSQCLTAEFPKLPQQRPNTRLTAFLLTEMGPGGGMPLTAGFLQNVPVGAAYRFCGLTPGRYLLQGRSYVDRNLEEAAGHPVPKDDTSLTAQFQSTIFVGESPLPPLKLTPEITTSLRGTLRVLRDGKLEAAPDGWSVALVHPSRQRVVGETWNATSKSGELAFPTIWPGNYRIEVQPPRGYRVVSITQLGRDLRNDLTEGYSPVEVVLGADGVDLQGRVLDADAKPVTDALIIATTGATGQADPVRTCTRSDQHGQYSFPQSFAPADYSVFVVPGLSPAMCDSVDLTRLNARKVELRSGTQSLDLQP